MAEKKKKTLDVWIVDTNNVYRDVPHTVVIDWVQQGRLLEDDRVRLAGKEDWHRIGNVPAFAPFLPKAEPLRVEDEAEALEPVHAEFGWKKKHDDEDDEVDMIPLIDISLVLLIFFMMTASSGGSSSNFNTPQAQYMLLAVDPEMVWVGIKPDGEVKRGKPVKVTYALGKGEATRADNLDEKQLLGELDALLKEQRMRVKINIRADKALPISVVNSMTTNLETFKQRGIVANIYAEVSEKEP